MVFSDGRPLAGLGGDVNLENKSTSDASAPSVQPRSTGSQRIQLRPELASAELASFEAADNLASAAKRILVLKLDHLGDFLIGIPALEQLREIFPNSHITLICGPWNLTTAQRLGVANAIGTFDYFPENTQDWDGKIAEDAIDRFREVSKGHFDIAVDLRVDEDTRPLLSLVDATLRCGIGSRLKHPYLSIVLPREFEWRETAPPVSELLMRPDRFHSRMVVQTPFYHETDFSITNTHLIYGPYYQLPLGELRLKLAYQVVAPAFWYPRVRMTIDVLRHDPTEQVAVLEVPRLPKSQVCYFDIVFRNDYPDARYEIRALVRGRPWWTRLRFFGMQLEVLKAPDARFRAAELHTGESLSLLVRLIAERTRALYRAELSDRIGSGFAGLLRPSGISAATKQIVVAPLGNSSLRNWPVERYARLVDLLLAEIDCCVALVGSRDQAGLLNSLQEERCDNPRVVNLVGQTDWSDLATVVGDADLVIANNSGIAHLAAACGTPTLAIYSGSHQPQEWGPRGRLVRTLMAAVPCSPCGHDRLEACPHDHLCMTLIEPENVLRHALEMLNQPTPSRQARTEQSLTP